ncbi:hypothetical protein OC610_25695, partial [Pseudomonas sp. SAICEU22]
SELARDEASKPNKKSRNRDKIHKPFSPPQLNPLYFSKLAIWHKTRYSPPHSITHKNNNPGDTP